MAQHVTHRRQYERRAIDVRVQLVIRESSRKQVAPTGGPSVPGRLKNASRGGAFVVVPVYLPRAAQVELEIPPGGTLPAGSLSARVMNVQMVDREPRYGVGLRFDDANSEFSEVLEQAATREAEG